MKSSMLKDSNTTARSAETFLTSGRHNLIHALTKRENSMSKFTVGKQLDSPFGKVTVTGMFWICPTCKKEFPLKKLNNQVVGLTRWNHMGAHKRSVVESNGQV